MTSDEKDPNATFDRELQELEQLERLEQVGQVGQSKWDKKGPSARVIYAFITLAIVAGFFLFNLFTGSGEEDTRSGAEIAESALDSATNTDRQPSSCDAATDALDRAMKRIEAGDKSDFDDFLKTVSAASEDMTAAAGSISDPEVREIVQGVQEALVGMEVSLELSAGSDGAKQYAKDSIEEETKALDQHAAALDALCKG